jgi:hypothetical protein
LHGKFESFVHIHAVQARLMNEIRWMTSAGAASWLTATAVAGAKTGTEVLFGMLGPLAAVIASWALMERTHRTSPERLTAVMIAAFAGKMVFFGAYVTVMLEVLALRPVPFIASFTGHFIGLYGMEALYLRRLLSNEAPPRMDGCGGPSLLDRRPDSIHGGG